ncbi:hypothetical protein EDC94DRAFT_646024 [Helicostylum pulchrum]|nr:hypothetical protein EDC94DRAFT_646024 [Helicostylum pulchrum]
MLSKSSNITVQLLEPTIFIEPSSNTHNVIRGTINLNLPKTTTISSLSVRFDGKMETKSYSFEAMENSGSFAQKKALTRQRLVLYPAPEQTDHTRPLVLHAGLTQYGFEMEIPSGLPESIDCSDVKVEYSVTAVMSVCINSFLRVKRRNQKECCKEVIRVVRLPCEDIIMGDNIADLVDSHTRKSAWMDYQITVGKKAVSVGSELPITFNFRPTSEGVAVDRVTVQMLERRDLYRDTTHTNHSVYTINLHKDNKTLFPVGALKKDWKSTVLFKVPENKTLVHSTQEYPDFKVGHTLLISISLSIPGTGHYRVQKLVTFQTSIDILDDSIGKMATLKLPTYDSPPPFDNTQFVFGEYDRKFADPPLYADIYA